MKTLKKAFKFLLIIIAIPIGLYGMELAFFPKKIIEYPINQQEFEDAEVLDVNYKMRANKFAVGKSKDSNGWYVSENESQAIDKKFPKKGLFLELNDKEFTLVEDKFLANKLYLVNNSEDEICFDAQDSRLYLSMQAKNVFGVWNDIEYIPNSWCGNSYHEVCIGNGEYWEFPSLQFKGRHKTKFRFKLEHGDSEIFSNEIEGFVNNGQFINKQKYFPMGIMDPYGE